MSFKVEIKGLEEVRKKLERLKQNAQALEGKNVPLEDILTPGFLRSHGHHGNIEEFLRAGGFVKPDEALTQERFESIPREALDKWVAEGTDLRSWDNMLAVAGTEYAKHKALEGF